MTITIANVGLDYIATTNVIVFSCLLLLLLLLLLPTEPPWSMPDSTWFQGQGDTLPVRMEVTFTDGSMDWIYNIVEFVPFPFSHQSLEVSVGSCVRGEKEC